MSLAGQSSLVTGSLRGIGRGNVDCAGAVIRTLVQIVSMWRQEEGCVHEPGQPEDDTGPAGDDNVTLSRTIRWSDGRNTTLFWTLPSAGA